MYVIELCKIYGIAKHVLNFVGIKVMNLKIGSLAGR